MARQPKRKKRIEQIYATTKGEVSEIAFTVDSRTGEISFGTDVTNVYSEISYDRPKGPKVLSRIPQADRRIGFDPGPALAKNYDVLYAVDTNTRPIQGHQVSVVGLVTFAPVSIPGPRALQQAWAFDVPFCLEYVDVKTKPENFGWLAAMDELRLRGRVRPGQRIGMVVDSDLGNLNDYNQRKKPLLEDAFLPENITLLYASSDAGKENVVNHALSTADSVSSQVLNALESGAAPFNARLRETRWFAGRRVVLPNLVRT